ncbi:MAG: MBL fold metallo-hydrolase [Selenomonadaceae bacterium]|nr:MBL fold metallo-hydrolase [Selenomonadaceae bacterium]
MKIQQIRNATLKINYAGKIFLVDPWLIAGQKFGRFVDIPGKPFHTPDPVREQIPMPIYDLPATVEEILRGVDYYILTHIHPDHIDIAPDGSLGAPLNKKIPIFAQNDDDAAALKNSGFESVEVLDEKFFGNVKLTKTPARHGTIAPLGEACGVIFSAPNEKTLYIVGDSVWFDGVQSSLKNFLPDVIIVNACAAELVDNGRLIMNDEDISCIAQALPSAKIIVSHMDNVAHATITRHEMRGLLARRGVENYFMPADGETIIF